MDIAAAEARLFEELFVESNDVDLHTESNQRCLKVRVRNEVATFRVRKDNQIAHGNTHGVFASTEKLHRGAGEQ